MPDAVAEKVIAIIAEVKRIDAAAITEASTFTDLQIDSLDALNIVFALEEEFNISVPDEDVRALKDVGSAIGGVRRLISAEAASA